MFVLLRKYLRDAGSVSPCVPCAAIACPSETIVFFFVGDVLLANCALLQVLTKSLPLFNMELYEHVVALNNHGVTLSSQGSVQALKASAPLFQKAIETTFALIYQEDAVVESSYPSFSPNRLGTRMGSCEENRRWSTSGIPMLACHRDIYLDSQDESRRSARWSGRVQARAPDEQVFLQALNLIPSLSAYSDDPLIRLAITSSILVFNLTVTHHRLYLISSEGGFDRAKLLQSLYNKCLNMRLDASQVSSGGRAVMELVVLASLNNVAQVAYMVGDFEQSRAYYRALIQYASLQTNQSLNYDPDTAMLLQLHKNAFFMNAFVFSIPSNAAAA